MRPVRESVGTQPSPEARFEQHFRRRYGELYGLAYRLLGDREEAEDVVQETLGKLAGVAESGRRVLERPDDEVAAWLRRVCLNAAHNRLRGQRRAADRLARLGRLERVSEPADDDPPVFEAMRAEEQRAVRRALLALPERQRACLLLRHAGYSYAEIADTLQIAIGSVGVLLARAERAFADTYLEPGDPTSRPPTDPPEPPRATD